LSSHFPQTFGALKRSRWGEPDRAFRSVKDEVRANLLARIGRGGTLFSGVVGYEDTVMPQIVNALLSRHNIILLGLRGQAKSRILRALTTLLDDVIPIVAGSEVNDNPFAPISKYARNMLDECGEATSIAWLERDSRFVEKLATPDVTVADIIGDVDPIKAARGGHILSDELTIHYGMLPRANRGIFALNELPDLAERIQVGMLNVLEERDVQVRGYKIRLPLDLMLVASANPEDYTNRGRIITPLKDRFGSQIRTHYPLAIDTEYAIMRQEARPLDIAAPIHDPSGLGGARVLVPEYLGQVIATFSHLARASNHVNQRSGVSVRLSVANYEALAANALRRGLRSGERSVVARVDDLEALAASSIGKIEIESLEEGREGAIFENLVKGAVLTVFKDRVEPERTRDVVTAFEEGAIAHTGEDITSAQLAGLVDTVPALRIPVLHLTGGDESPAAVAAAVEFVLEGLHLSKRLNKDASGNRATYRGRV